MGMGHVRHYTFHTRRKPGMKWYNKKGDAITAKVAMRIQQNATYAGIKCDIVDGIVVSTIWTGMGEICDKDGMPMIFETRVFEAKANSDICFYVKRYGTIEEARLGHNKVHARLAHNLMKVTNFLHKARIWGLP